MAAASTTVVVEANRHLTEKKTGCEKERTEMNMTPSRGEVWGGMNKKRKMKMKMM